MESVPRGSDGRRLFSPEFKREQVARLVRGEVTISELSRELGIDRATACRERGPRARRYHRRDDTVVYSHLKAVLRDRGS